MRIARVAAGGFDRLGVVDAGGNEIRLLGPDVELGEMLTASSRRREELAESASDPVALADVVLRTPLDPPTVRDFVTFEEHVDGMVGAGNDIPPEWYELPTFYFSNPYGMVASGVDVEIPPGCEALDFELEVAVIIGRPGRDLTPEQARDYIAGYTIFNDWSARDLQAREMRVMLGPCKGKDFATTLGPWIVTADELEPYRIGDRLDLDLQVWLNDEEFGEDTLAHMGWSFDEMVAYASRGTWVRPGDVLGSGTCGRGCMGELWGRRGERDPRPLAPGDEVTMIVEGIGSISNRIVAGREPVAIAPARPPGQRRPRPE
jgi:2-keto-4-pentenoate hydratase/2-oxohepta-3-ene-1,7-dioic acid hydratase in catechol pathway